MEAAATNHPRRPPAPRADTQGSRGPPAPRVPAPQGTSGWAPTLPVPHPAASRERRGTPRCRQDPARRAGRRRDTCGGAELLPAARRGFGLGFGLGLGAGGQPGSRAGPDGHGARERRFHRLGRPRRRGDIPGGAAAPAGLQGTSPSSAGTKRGAESPKEIGAQPLAPTYIDLKKKICHGGRCWR